MARDRSKLGDAEVQAFLQRAPGWALEGGMLKKTFAFADFRAAMSFVSRVADAAEAADHHPDIDIRYTTISMVLSTHSAGGLTAKDFDLAERIEQAAR